MSRKNSTARAVGIAISGAAIAAFVGMGTAHADDTVVIPAGWEDLLGAPGTEGLAAGQGAADLTYDTELFDNSPGSAAAFEAAVISFQETGTEHGITQLIYALDPSTFVAQTTDGIDGYLTGADAGAYLVPDDFLGYLATDLDFFLLNPTGLDPLLLGPLIETLLGFPVGV
jgi:hypothetical protein